MNTAAAPLRQAKPASAGNALNVTSPETNSSSSGETSSNTSTGAFDTSRARSPTCLTIKHECPDTI